MDALGAEEVSSSSSLVSPPPCLAYHVFVSFRGEDIRNTFASHLFVALKDNGFRTFKDDKELERGERIDDGLVKAIVGSEMFLILFSKKYAESRWCLDELVEIMNICKGKGIVVPGKGKQIVLPIFYDVEPTDVRKQGGDFKEAFEEHIIKHSHERVEKWRTALKAAADLPGLTLRTQAGGDEAKLIKMIIEEVRKNVNRRLHVPDQQVGLELRVGQLKAELLKMESDSVGIVAIWGMGGIGKTTIATRLYNDIQQEFGWSGFIADVRETWQRDGRDVLQKKLLTALLKETSEVSNYYEGIELVYRIAFRGKKALLVLDDVDDVKQLEALAIDRKCFPPGSRIIITTRNMSSLNKLKVDKTYEPQALDKGEALELFSRHAFEKVHPPGNYLNLSGQIVLYAKGLPLAIEVLGSYLHGRSIPQWNSAISKLKTIPDDRVQGILKLSYDSLSNNLKELFLDMACFFIGTDRGFTTKMLEHCQKFAECGIQDLADRCLVKYGPRGEIVIHDMLRDMGREIVMQESPHDPGKRSRLWNHKDVLDVLKNGKGTEKVKGILLNATKVQENATKKRDRMGNILRNALKLRRDGRGIEAVEVKADAFEKMDELWLLHLDYCHLNAAGHEQIFRNLLWLSWKGFPMKCLPRNLYVEKLVALDLRWSSLTSVRIENMIMDKLKFLYLSHCHYLTRTPDFSGLYSLEELWLDSCISLVEVDESIGNAKELRILVMNGCKKLQKLPSGIWMLKKLEHLDLSGCSNLGITAGFKGSLHKLWCSISSWTFPTEGVDSIGLSHTSVHSSGCLTRLNLQSCNLSYLPAEIWFLTSLKELDLSENSLCAIPNGIGKLEHLENLSLACNDIGTLPDTICGLACLESLDLSDCNLSHLPCEIGKLIKLNNLDLSDNRLDTLPDSIWYLTCLTDLDLGGSQLSCLPDGIGGLSSLMFLVLDDTDICTLPESISDLPLLRSIQLARCAKLQSLPKLPAACVVYATRCPSLGRLPLELDKLPEMVICSNSNKVAENNFISSLLEQLPKSKGLSKIKRQVYIVVPAGSMDLYCFPDKDMKLDDGTLKVSFAVPHYGKQKILGWILRIIYASEGSRIADMDIVELKCNKVSIEGFCVAANWFCTSMVDTIWLLYTPQGYKKLQLQGGDYVEITIHIDYAVRVDNWAIDLIYEADENRVDGNVNKVVSI